MGVIDNFRKNWFLYAIVVFIIFAKFYPWIGRKGGPMYPEFTIKYIAVSVIFFISGLSLKTEDLTAAIFHYRLHAFIQIFTFVFIPAAIFLLTEIFNQFRFNYYLLTGIRVLSCMPPPVSSAVIITKAIGGNVAGAIFNSALGSFLGIFITPSLLYLIVGVTGNVPVMAIIQSLTITVVCPLFFGQFCRQYIKSWMERTNPPLGQIGSFMLLMIIYTTFCDTFTSNVKVIQPVDLFILAITILLIQLTLLYFIFVVTDYYKWGFKDGDIISLMFCSTHKSLTLGMPILKIMYAGDVVLPFMSIPLLIYHPTQILLGGFLVPLIKGWLNRNAGAGLASTV